MNSFYKLEHPEYDGVLLNLKNINKIIHIEDAIYFTFIGEDASDNWEALFPSHEEAKKEFDLLYKALGIWQE